MAVPKKKPSIHKRRIRRANWAKVYPEMVNCDHCGAYKIAHRVCDACGMYRGRKII